MAATLSPPVAEAADEPRTIYIALPQVQTRRGYLVFKRCFDFTFALLALIVLAVPMGIIAAIIALDSPGGPIYRQERLGKDGKPFLICKFRSMRMDAEKDGQNGPNARRPLHTLWRAPAQDAAGRAAAALEHSEGRDELCRPAPGAEILLRAV